MKWKFMAKTAALFMALLSIKEIPINGESKEINLDEAQQIGRASSWGRV